MQPLLDAWWTSHGLPLILVPTSMMLTGLAGFAGGFWVLRQARLDGAPVHEDARALAVSFVFSWGGAMVGAALLSLPTVAATRSLSAIDPSAKNLWGALVFGALVPAVLLLCFRRDPRPFLDRLPLLFGPMVVGTRLGCLLHGCHFGTITASAIGIRYPAGSGAAISHAARGFTPAFAASLPVHPAPVYEALVAVGATAAACALLRVSRERKGLVLASWFGLYSGGRLVVEAVRADAPRGALGMTSGQALALAIGLASLGLLALRKNPARLAPAPARAALASVLVLVLAPKEARADEPSTGRIPEYEPPTPMVESPTTYPRPTPQALPTSPSPTYGTPPHQAPAYQAPTYMVPWNSDGSAARDRPVEAVERPVGPGGVQHEHRVGVRFTGLFGPVLGRTIETTGGGFELAVSGHLPLSPRARFDLGIDGRRFTDKDASHWTIGLPAEFVFEPSRHLTLLVGLTPGFTRIVFDSPFYDGGSAFSARAQFGLGFPIADHVAIGLSPLAFQAIFAQPRLGGVYGTYEPRIWIAASF